jgi:ABC-type sugar transport system substrate-binding protein
MQAGYDHARLHIVPDDEAASPSRAADGSSPPSKSQAELVRGRLADKPRALIVDPDDPADQDLAKAIQEVRAAKVPVVVVGRPVVEAGKSKVPGAAPLILVAPHVFAESAHRLVDLSIRNLQKAKVDPARGALILITGPADRLLPDRAGAIRKALADAKIDAVEELRVSRELTAGSKALKQRLQEDTKPVMVLFLDWNGASIARDAASDLGEGRSLVLAGYTADETRNRMVLTGDYAAVAEYDPSRLVRKAVNVAAAAAQGRESRELEEVSINILESPLGSGLTTVQTKRSAMENNMKKNSKGE